MPGMTTVLPTYRARQRRERLALADVMKALQANDGQAMLEALPPIDPWGWTRLMRRIARLQEVAPELQDAWVQIWIKYGDHIRLETGNDLVLASALRVLLPPYKGPSITLYRGEGFENRRRRTYGLSWSSDHAVGESYAATGNWRTCIGGSVLLRATAPPEAIICNPGAINNRYGEDEYLVDRRFLKDIAVLQRYTHCTHDQLDQVRQAFRP